MALPANKVFFVLAVLSAAGAAYLLWPKSPESPEEIITRQVTRMANAASERDVGGVMEYVSEQYRSEDGALDKQTLRSFLAAQILRGQWVRVWPVDTQVRMVSAEAAEFVGTFVLSRSESESVRDLPKDSVFGSYEIRGEVVREADGVWRFVSSAYHPVDATQLF